MTPSRPPIEPESSFAVTVRDASEVVLEQRRAFLADSVAAQLLEAMPGPAMVLNPRRQIVAANRLLLSVLGKESLDCLLGRRPGEVFACVNATNRPGGCGASEACTQCGAVLAILESLASRGRSTRECRVRTWEEERPGALDVRVHATFMSSNGQDFVVVGLEDISSEKRRRVLERVFFHDIGNTCAALRSLTSMLEMGCDRETEEACKHDLARLSTMVADEISAHRSMLAAERGELEVAAAEVEISALFAGLAAAYRNHLVAEGRSLRFLDKPSWTLRTDPALLRRVLGNLIKNALEASGRGEIVTVDCKEGESGLIFSVHNPAFIPREVQLQIFQRSFSTKGDSGRGIGTYSVKLFGERYLRGAVSFTSSAEAGTTFCLALPWDVGDKRKV